MVPRNCHCPRCGEEGRLASCRQEEYPDCDWLYSWVCPCCGEEFETYGFELPEEAQEPEKVR